MNIREIGLKELISMPLELYKKILLYLKFSRNQTWTRKGMHRISMLIIPFYL